MQCGPIALDPELIQKALDLFQKERFEEWKQANSAKK
jgi:hypothetical protein